TRRRSRSNATERSKHAVTPKTALPQRMSLRRWRRSDSSSSTAAIAVIRQHLVKSSIVSYMSTRSGATPTTFAERLRTLVDTVHPPGRGRFTQAEISAGVKDLGGDLSQQYLSRLLRGVNEPSDRIVRYIAAFFGVTSEYFFDDAEYKRTND